MNRRPRDEVPEQRTAADRWKSVAVKTKVTYEGGAIMALAKGVYTAPLDRKMVMVCTYFKQYFNRIIHL